MKPSRRAACLGAALLGLALASAATAAPAQRPDGESLRCLRCHGMPNFAERDSATATVRDLHVDRRLLESSAHGALSCRSCHPDVTASPHAFPGGRPRVSCGAGCHATDRRGRPYSHAKEASDFAASAHGSGRAASNPDSPTCTTCHGGGDVHGIPRAARAISAPEKMELCACCHDDRAMMARNHVEPSAVASYRRSFHYKAIHFGVRGTAVCQDCHTAHRVLARRDTASTVARAHLPGTCGQRGCHPGARMNFAMSGANHLALRIEREPVLRLEERFFVGLTVGTMAALLGGIVLDVQRRLGWLVLAAAARRRMAAALRGIGKVMARGMTVARRLLVD